MDDKGWNLHEKVFLRQPYAGKRTVREHEEGLKEGNFPIVWGRRELDESRKSTEVSYWGHYFAGRQRRLGSQARESWGGVGTSER